MDAVNRWAIIEDGKVKNVIIADETFIKEQKLNAVQDALATVGLNVDDKGKILYPEVLVQPELIVEETPTE